MGFDRGETLEQRSIPQRDELRAREGEGYFRHLYDCACLLGEPTSRRGVHFRRRTRRHPSRAGMYRILKPARVSATIERSWRLSWLHCRVHSSSGLIASAPAGITLFRIGGSADLILRAI